MRNHRRVEAFILLSQLTNEVFDAVRALPACERPVMGQGMQAAVTEAVASIVRGCATRNSGTFIPYLEAALGHTEMLGVFLRQCRRMRLLDETPLDFLLQRQETASRVVQRLLQRQVLKVEQARTIGAEDEFEWPTDDDEEEDLRVNEEPPRRGRGRPARGYRTA